jgi:hypothetical protein
MNLTSCATVVSIGVFAALGTGPALSADKAASPQTAEVLGKLHHSKQMEIAAGKVAARAGGNVPPTGAE